MVWGSCTSAHQGSRSGKPPGSSPPSSPGGLLRPQRRAWLKERLPAGKRQLEAGQGHIPQLDKNRTSPKHTSSPCYGLGEEALTTCVPQDSHSAMSRRPWSQACCEGCPRQPCAHLPTLGCTNTKRDSCTHSQSTC